MKVLHIIDSLGLGGAQTIVKGIFEKQQKNKDIFLYSLRKREINIKINHPNVFAYPSTAKYSFKPMKELRKLIEKEKIDILHCHLVRSQIFGYRLKKNYFPNIKLIFHEHGRIFTNNLLYNLFLKRAKDNVDLFIAVSKATKQKLIENANINPKKIVVLYNFVDLDKFNRKNIKWNIQKEREKLGIKKGEYVIGFVGRLNKVKGCEYLIRALPYLEFDYKVLIAGDGPERNKLESLAEKLNVREKVIFLGYQENMVWFYSLLNVLVVPSLSESFGLSVVEAQAMGILVLASDTIGLDEVIEDKKTGLLIKTKNSKNIAEKIETIKENMKFRQKIVKNSLLAIKKYTLSNYITKLSKVYKK